MKFNDDVVLAASLPYGLNATKALTLLMKSNSFYCDHSLQLALQIVHGDQKQMNVVVDFFCLGDGGRLSNCLCIFKASVQQSTRMHCIAAHLQF